MTSRPSLRVARPAQGAGFSLIELMVSIGISMVLIAGLAAMLVNVSSNNNEMAKHNAQIENGRFAIQALEMDLSQAGYWGTFVPQFDDMAWARVPDDTPGAVPDPCLAYSAAAWDDNHVNNLVGIPVAASDTMFANCTGLTNQVAGTAVLVVRHAEACVAGSPGCTTLVNGKMYFQASLCAQPTSGTARGGSVSTIVLPATGTGSTTSSVENAYVGMRIRTLAGAGSGQSGTITAYNGVTNTATVSGWTVAVNDTTRFTIREHILAASTGAGTLATTYTNRARGANCSTAASAPLRKFVSNIYYVRNFSVTAGDGIPTLVRSEFDPGNTVALAHQVAVPLVEGIQNFQVELGVDDTVTRCTPTRAVNYGVEPNLVVPSTCVASTTASANTLPTNRGDGNPDQYVRCTAAVPCTAAQLTNVVSAKLYVLVRNTQATQGYTDTKTYCLGPNLATGCTTGRQVGPFDDGFQRHLYTTTVRLPSVAGRRETP